MSINRKRQRRLRQREKQKQLNRKLDAVERAFDPSLRSPEKWVFRPGGKGFGNFADILKNQLLNSTAVANIKDDGKVHQRTEAEEEAAQALARTITFS